MTHASDQVDCSQPYSSFEIALDDSTSEGPADHEPYLELRRYPRVQPSCARARVISHKRAAVCRVENLSLGGMLLGDDAGVCVGQRVWTHLMVPGVPPLGMAGMVVRIADHGFAVRFSRMSLAKRTRLDTIVTG